MKNDLPSLIESGIAEFDGEFTSMGYGTDWRPGFNYSPMDIKTFLTSFATNVHNAAIESALEALPKEVPNGYEATKLGFGMAIEEARAKLSALKKENV